MIEQYMALALQPVMRGTHQRSEITRNLDHIAELARAAIWLTAIDLPVRLITIPEGALQGFTDEIFDWDHVDYVNRTAIDIPGPETQYLGDLAKDLDTYIVAQAKAKHPDRFEKIIHSKIQKESANENFKKIQKAYETLKKG